MCFCCRPSLVSACQLVVSRLGGSSTRVVLVLTKIWNWAKFLYLLLLIYIVVLKNSFSLAIGHHKPLMRLVAIPALLVRLEVATALRRAAA
jgi:hypothetical protein